MHTHIQKALYVPEHVDLYPRMLKDDCLGLQEHMVICDFFLFSPLLRVCANVCVRMQDYP